MPETNFVHLHNHTEYSLLDGACRIVDDKGNPAELLKFISSCKMPALAITDHGNMFGAIEFYSACRDIGIKPIIGCELYLTGGSRFVKQQNSGQQQQNFHITLLAKNNTGYENLMKIVSAGYLEGFYYKPRIDKEVLAKYSQSDGLICLSGCLHGEIPTAVMEDREKDALQLVEEYKSLFGKENFYIELMDNGMKEQKELIPKLLEIAKKTETPVVATNDCHYLRREDAFAHDVLLCIGTGTTLDAPKRLKFSTDQFYYKTSQEMVKIFSEIPSAIENTLSIAEKCNVEIDFSQLLLPYYQTPHGETPESYLRKLCEKGLKERYSEITAEIKNRLEHELEIINKMNFAPYFLIVWDFVNYAKKNNIPVGPGRGSGAGSLVAYCLGITDICPIKYGLLFERFLNPERRTMPDLDIDFADYGRDKVISYVRKKYGEQNVAQIITFGTMQARLVIRDVARVMGFSVSDGDRIAKLIPQGMTIYQALNNVSELKEIYESEPNIKRLIDTARQIEGLKRHHGVHAAGLVIAKDDITKFAPLSKSTKKLANEEEVITTQYNDDSLIKLGLLKIDFLGLRTLTVLEETQRLVNIKHKDFNIKNIPLDDKKTFELLQKANTTGVFQLESSGMRDLLRKLRPTVFEDIIALVALYRPGPMGSGMLDEFVERKHHPQKIKYDHPLLEAILKETYGIIVYQEQVMQIAQVLAGFSSAQADILRRAMGKKIPEEIEQQEDAFLEGAKRKNIDRRIAKKIFDQIVHFGGYGFNKSHAAAYGLLAYRTAYLKANFPLEYMCALLTSEIGRSSIGKEEGSRLVNYIQETKSLGIEILPPDVQKSDIVFSIENNKIRFGLLAIKNVGEHAAKNIVSVRRRDGPFKSLMDFCNRVDPRQVNKKVIESLIKAGAFDFLNPKEESILPAYIRPKLIQEMESLFKVRDKFIPGQKILFEETGQELEKIEPWPDHVVLGFEKEVLGFYLSGHPLAQYREVIENVSTCKLNSIQANSCDVIKVAGVIANVKRLSTRNKGEQMAKFRLENFDGEIDVLVFPKTYTSFGKFIIPQSLIVVKGRISTRDENPTIIADEIIPLDKFEHKAIKQAKQILIKFSSAGVDDTFLGKIKSLLSSHPGDTLVYFNVTTPLKKSVLIKTQLKVSVSEKLLNELKTYLGENSWEIK